MVDQQRCTDEEKRSSGASGSFSGGTGTTGGGGGGYVPMHRWYYYPSGSRLPIVGSIAPSSGSFTAPSSGVVRGGFGSTASGSVVS